MTADEARAKMIRRVTREAGITPTDLVAFESDENERGAATMAVYSVSGKISVLGFSAEAALNALRVKVRDAEMGVTGETVVSDGPGYFATGTLAGLFRAESKEAAMRRFMNRILSRSGSLPHQVLAFEAEDVTEGWIL